MLSMSVIALYVYDCLSGFMMWLVNCCWKCDACRRPLRSHSTRLSARIFLLTLSPWWSLPRLFPALMNPRRDVDELYHRLTWTLITLSHMGQLWKTECGTDCCWVGNMQVENAGHLAQWAVHFGLPAVLHLPLSLFLPVCCLLVVHAASENLISGLYTVSQKKVPTFKLSVTLSNLNRFSKFLHC